MLARPWLTAALSFLLAAACAVAARAQAADPATEPAAATPPLLLQEPRTDEDVAARIRLAEEQLAALAPTTRPAAEDEMPAAEARRRLHAAWQEYLAEAQRLASMREHLAALTRAAHIEQLGAALAELEQEAAGVRGLPVPPTASAADAADATARSTAVERRLAERTALQAGRSARLAGGFAQQREALAAEADRLRAARQQLREQMPATTAPAEAEARALEQARLEVDAARVALARATLAADEQRTELARRQTEREIEALRAVAAALRERLAALAEAEDRGALEALALQRRAATQPHRRAFLDLQYFVERARAGVFRDPPLLEALSGRFPPGRVEQLRARVATSAAVWDETVRSVDYRAGRDVLRLQREAARRRGAFQEERAALQATLAESVSELHRLQLARDRALRRLDALTRTLEDALRDLPPAEGARLETEATTLRAELETAIRTTLDQGRQLVDRLRASVELLSGHVDHMDAAVKELYGHALRRRESGLAGIEWSRAWSELRQLLGQHPPAADPDDDDLLELALADTAPDVRDGLAARLLALRADLAALRPGDWLLTAALVIVAAAAGVRIRQRAAARARAAAEESPAEPRARGGPGPRAAWGLVAELAVPLAVAAALALAAWASGLAPRTRTPAVALLTLLAGTYVALRIVHRVLPRDGVWPTDPATARHCGAWCTALLALTLVAGPIWLVLAQLRVTPALEGLVCELYKTGVLIALLGLLLRSGRAPAWSRSARRGVLRAALAAARPLLLLAVGGLLALQVIGYGLLVEYVGLRLLASAAIVGLAAAGAAGADLLSERIPRPAARPRSSGGAADSAVMPGAGAGPADAHPGSPRGARDAAPRVAAGRLVRSPLRVLIAAAAVLLVLEVWGGPAYRQWVSGRMLALLAAMLAGAVLLDRLAQTALRSLQVSGRIPESVGNIVRRWLRGLLTAVVALLVVALAGYEVASLWAPVSALLAMVAIGFVAVWSLLSNVLATFLILVWRPFNVGERIEVQPEGIAGEVIDINFIYTLLRGEGGVQVVVPNALFLQKFIRRQRLRGAPQRTLAEQLVADRPARG